MGAWRQGRMVILVGGFGMVAGALLGAGADPPGSIRDLQTKGSVGSLVASLLLLGLAVWHAQSWGAGKLVVIGVMAAGGFGLTLQDFGDGDMLWQQGFTGVELVARWVLVVSAAVVLVGVPWSFAEVIRSPGRRAEAATDDVATSVAWWRRWGLLVVGGAVALWFLGVILAGGDDEATPADLGGAAGADESDEDDREPLADEEWTVALNEGTAGVYTVVMIENFGALDESDVEDVAGRLVWEETEIELCGVRIRSVGDGFVQVGDIFRSVEGCEGDTSMQQTFDELGPPETACVSVRVGGVDDERCAPLTLGIAETESES